MKVALLMGSDSDLKRLEPCLAVLAKLEIPCLARVLSAHRTPEALASFVQEEAPAQSVRVFICAAGGAAHLAGVVAAHTNLPVLGIPMDDARGCSRRDPGGWLGGPGQRCPPRRAHPRPGR